MKRLALLLTCVAALALTAGCNKDAAKMSDTLTATFNVTLPGDMPTKAISDGTLATELLFMVFDSEDHHLEALDQTVAVNGKKATVTTDLVRGVDYKFVFWAQKPGKYSFAEKNGRYVLEISANALPSMMNDDTWDAFYASEAVEAQVGDFTLDVTLYRPFAQLNVGSSAEDIAVAEANAVDLGINLKTAFTIDGVKNVLDLVSGTASGAESVTYTAALAPTDYIVTTDNETYRRIAMVYVLAANQSSTSQVTLNVQSRQSNSIDLAFAREVPNVPLRRNHRTNIVGEIFSLTGTFNVLVDERFDEPEYNVDIDVPAAAPTTYNVSVYENIVNGTVAVDAETTSFEEGENVTLVVKPGENYELSMLTYAPADGGSAVDIDMQTLQFAMPAYDVVVSARFAYVEPGPTEPEYTGSGTADDPYTVADVRKYIDNMENPSSPSDEEVYVKGVVSRIANNGQFSARYGNAVFFMTDPDGTDEFEAYRIKYFNNAAWQEGDQLIEEGQEIVLVSKVTLYTPASGGDSVYETYYANNSYNGYLISINGNDGSEGGDNPETPTTYNVSVYENIVNGTVAVAATTTSFEEGETVTLTVQPDENYELSMLTYAPADGGSAVDIDMQTLQFAMPAYDVVVSARFAYVGSGPTEPEYTGSGTADDPYTVADVRKYIDGLGDAGTVSDNAVYVKGVVKSIAGRPSATYSNASFYMTDPDGTDEFEAFRIYFLGDNPWTVNDIMVAEGDEVVVCGKVKLYVSGSNQTYETNQVPNGDHGYLVSLNGKSAAADAPTIEARDVTGAPVTVIPVGSNGITVTITAAQGATVRYTTDGNDPTENSPVYTSPFLVSEACTVKAFVEGDDTTLASAVASLKITKDSGTTYSWVATPLAQIPTGSEIVIVSQKGDAYYAMSNNNGTISAPSAVAVTVTNDTMDTPDDNIIWTLTKAEGTTTETYQFGTGDSYLYCTAANNGLRVGTGDNKTFHVNVDNDYLVNDGQTRYVGVYNAQDWRSYTSVNNNISGQTFLYFMKTN